MEIIVKANGPGQTVLRCLMGLLLALNFARPSADAGAAEITGWRTDGTGRYPEASPVLEWGPEKNVIWKTPMPDRGNATPVITGDRIFVCAEPATLICVDRSDGRILWQRENTYDALLAADPEEGARLRTLMQEAAEINAALDKVLARQQEIRRTIKKKGPNPELESEKARLQKEAAGLREELKPYEEYAVPKAHEVNGYSSATPVTDGSHVWMPFGTGMVVCYDVEGSLKWFKRLENPGHSDYGFCASPVLAGGRLIVHPDHLWGLDPATGEVAWKVKLPWAWGTPVPARIGEREVVFTAKGNVVRAHDGKVLPAKLVPLDYNGPVVLDDIVYYVQHNGRAFRLAEVVDETAEPEEIWQTRIRKERYYGSPLIHEGLIYLITRYKHLVIVDEATGELVYEKTLDMGKGEIYTSITLGGKYLFVSCENGTTIVLEPGREYKEVSRNKLEEFRTCPVFDEARMYVRGSEHLYCIGTGE